MKNKTFFNSVKAVLLSMAIMATSCISMNVPADSAVIADAATKIKLNKTKLTLHVGYAYEETYQLKITGTNKKAKWSTSNKNIAAVSQKGKITAKKIGKAVITAKVSGKELKCSVIVKKEDPSASNEEFVSITGGNFVYVGGYNNLNATASISDDKDIKWTTSNPDIATVSNGYVYGVSPGTVTITASTDNAKASKKITVLAYNTTLSVDCAATITLNQNDYKVINVTTDMGSAVSYDISSHKIISAKWGTANDLTMPLRIQAEGTGTAYLTIYDSHNPELNKKITVIVNESVLNNSSENDPDINKPGINNPIADNEQTTAFDQLYQTISNSRLINDDGNHIINYSLDGWTFAIAFDTRDNKFYFVGYSDEIAAKMTIDRNGSKISSVYLVYISKNAGSGFDANAYINLETFTKNTVLDFAITNLPYNDAKLIRISKDMANSSIQACISGWKICLMKNSNLTLKDIGFLSY